MPFSIPLLQLFLDNHMVNHIDVAVFTGELTRILRHTNVGVYLPMVTNAGNEVQLTVAMSARCLGLKWNVIT